MDNFNFELAIKFCERALDMEPENVEVLEMAGAVFLETGDVDKAKSVSFKPDFIITHFICCYLLLFCFYVVKVSNKLSSLLGLSVQVKLLHTL